MSSNSSFEEFADFRQLFTVPAQTAVPCLVVSAGTCGQASGANDLIRVIKRQILERGLHDQLSLRITGCMGFCQIEPFILVEPSGVVYPRLRHDQVGRVVDAVLADEVVEELLYREPGAAQPCPTLDDLPFYRGQRTTVLGGNRHIDPIRVLDYMRRGGYAAFEKVLKRGEPAWVVDEVKRGGLRGRGGAGFPTGVKWELASRQPGAQKFIVCNADEGDPGAYMDRSLLEGNPHAVIEGMLIAAYAIGATEGIIYVRCEYPLAIKHALIALRQARDIGVLGQDILGTGFSFDIEIVEGAGAFVCGEETALIRSIEGYMGEPRQRPPYPVQRGIDGCPTCINNVETLANVPLLIDMGAESYAAVGAPGNAGTKIFSLVGKIKNTGLVEVPLGTPIQKVVYEIGGGPVGDARIKAVQTGGPSGGCIPASKFDLPIDYDHLREAGSIMGSGGMIVMDENTCMVDVARYFMRFLMEESCGKCFTCRKGTQRLYELLDDITKGRGTLEHLDLLEELADVVKDTTLCGLGQSAPNPVKSTLRYFRDEFVRHIVDKRCDAFVCRDLVGAPCATACPVGTEAWRYVAHIAAGELEQAYLAIREANPFPSVCARVCHHPCEQRCRAGTSGGQPIAIRALKRFVTDRVPVETYKAEMAPLVEGARPVAIIGAGPSGLTAAHYLARAGYRSTVFEADSEPGGMLYCAIPEYRLPRAVIRKEIEALIGGRVTVECGKRLGTDITVDGLLAQGFGAVYIAIGSHRTKKLRVEGEETDGVYPSMRFIKAFNTQGESLARGRVGVIGGGNSAIDAARIAIRQTDVESVTIYYRRTRAEMPAFEEEIDAAIEEGIALHTLVTPVRVVAENGRLAKLELVRNELGEMDSSGRRRPRPLGGTEHAVELDTLIVAISEESDTDCIQAAGSSRIAVSKWGAIQVDKATLATNRPGVFAGGDAVTGPNTVIDAIAHGKLAARVIARYLGEQPLLEPAVTHLPEVYVAPPPAEERAAERRVETPKAPAEWRRRSFAEVDISMSVEEAKREALRCLRCDLEFTQPLDDAAGAGAPELVTEGSTKA